MATTLLNTSHNVYSAGGTSDAYTFYFGLTLDSQDTPGNQSSFTATWGAKGNYGYTYNGFSGLGVTLYISTDGSNWESLGYTGVSKITATQTNYASKPFTKGHNNDGSLTIYYRAVYNGGSTSYVPRADTYTSGALSVTKIPRASTLNVATTCNVNNSTGSLAVSVTKAYSGYYDRFSYSIGSVVGRVVDLGTGTSGSIPYSTILNALPTTAVATLKITLATYSDSGYTSLIGRSEKEVAVTIDISAIKPSITINEHCVVNTTNIAGYCFAGFGTLRAKFTSNLSYGASSVSTKYTISYGQLEITSSTGTSQVTVKSLTMPTQSTNRTGVTITATATDSRGASASITTNGATVYGYVPPVVSGNFYRCNSSNTADEQGEYAYGSWSAAVGTSTGSNSIQSIVSTFNNNTSGRISLAQTSSGTYTVTATDKVGGTTRQTFTVASAVYPLQLLDNGGGRVAVGFGMPPTSEKLVQSALPIHEMKGHYVHSTPGQTGQGGFAKICTINTQAAYINTPIEITLHARTTLSCTIIIRFNNSGDPDPGLSVFQGDTDHGIYLAKTATSRWAVFVRKSEAYDTIVVDDIKWRADYIRSYITWEYDGKSWTDAELQALAGLTGLSRLNKKIDIYGTATTAQNIDIVNADGVANAGWRTDVNGNLVHKRTTASDTFNIMNNAGASQWALKWEDGTVTSPANYPLRMTNGNGNSNHYIANDANGIYIATFGSANSGDSIYLETYDTDIYHRLNGSDRRIFDDGNVADNWKLLYSGDYSVASTTNITLTNGARYQFLVFNMRTGTDAYFRWSMSVPPALLGTSKGNGYWGVSGTTQYAGVYLWKSGNNVIMCGGASGNTGNIYYVYGVGGAR